MLQPFQGQATLVLTVSNPTSVANNLIGEMQDLEENSNAAKAWVLQKLSDVESSKHTLLLLNFPILR